MGKGKGVLSPSSWCQKTKGVVGSFRLEPEKLVGWSLLPVVVRKKVSW
jgi:hypothetical protein